MSRVRESCRTIGKHFFFFFASLARHATTSRLARMGKGAVAKNDARSNLHERECRPECLPLIAISASHIVGTRDCRLGMRVCELAVCRAMSPRGNRWIAKVRLSLRIAYVYFFIYLRPFFFFTSLRIVSPAVWTALKIIGIAQRSVYICIYIYETYLM